MRRAPSNGFHVAGNRFCAPRCDAPEEFSLGAAGSVAKGREGKGREGKGRKREGKGIDGKSRMSLDCTGRGDQGNRGSDPHTQNICHLR